MTDVLTPGTLAHDIDILRDVYMDSRQRLAWERLVARLEDAPKPLAWMRRWYYNGEKPTRRRNEEGRMVTPLKYKLYPVTTNQVLPDDVPLFGGPTADAAGLDALVAAALPFDALYQPDDVMHMGDTTADDHGIFGVNRATVKLGHLRALRAALRGLKR